MLLSARHRAGRTPDLDAGIAKRIQHVWIGVGGTIRPSVEIVVARIDAFESFVNGPTRNRQRGMRRIQVQIALVGRDRTTRPMADRQVAVLQGLDQFREGLVAEIAECVFRSFRDAAVAVVEEGNQRPHRRGTDLAKDRAETIEFGVGTS